MSAQKMMSAFMKDLQNGELKGCDEGDSIEYFLDSIKVKFEEWVVEYNADQQEIRDQQQRNIDDELNYRAATSLDRMFSGPKFPSI